MVLLKKELTSIKTLKIIRQFVPFLFSQVQQMQLSFFAMLFLIIITIALNISAPLVLKKIVTALSFNELMFKEKVFFLLFLYGFLWTFSRITSSLREIVTFRIAEASIRHLCLKIFEHLHSLSLSFHVSRHTGAISTTIDSAQRAFPIVFWGFIFFILPTTIEILIATSVLWYLYDITYGIMLLCVLIGYLFFSVVASRWTINAQKDSNEKCLKASAYIADSLINFETIKYLGGHLYEYNYCNKILKEREEAQIKKNIILESVCIGQGLIVGAGLTLLIWITGNAVYSNTLGTSDFILINGYLIQFFTPLSFFGIILRDMRKGLYEMKNIFNILHLKPKIKESPQALELKSEKIEVSFKNVSFGYEENRPVLKGLSFDIPSGKTVAIVGPTGSGKSTIVRLLFRLYDVSGGQILINGIDIRNIKQASLQEKIGVVPQDITLFNDTILHNIAYSCPDIAMEEICKVAKTSGLDEFIKKLPSGYDSIVGERGLKLSGGEKQRISIARVLLRKPALFIFDEATSSLDVQTEQNIQKNIEKISQNATTLIIAHRLTTVVNADEIIVLNNGAIEERGTHSSLLAKGGLYSHLWRIQAQKGLSSIILEDQPTIKEKPSYSTYAS